MGLGSPPSTDRFDSWIRLYPGLRFKLDANAEWTDELIQELAATGAVDSVDLKGQYRGTVVDAPADPALYRRVAEGLPDAWLEDPGLTPETEEVLEPHRDRVTWDALIHSVEDIESLPWPPKTVNVKPSRFGSVERLFAAYDYCEAHGIGAYGGGQWELGPGRLQIQLLAALFHPDTPNDVAPREFNLEPQAGLACEPAPRGAPSRPDSSRCRRARPYVSVPRKSSIEIRGSDSSFALPRAPSATDTFAIVTSSGASTMLTKSYPPSAAHWWSTFAPISSTSRFTSRSRAGFACSVWIPFSVSVVSIRYVGIWLLSSLAG